MLAAVQVEHERAEERAQLSAKLHLAKAAHKRLKADMQAQVDKTAATAAELALSQVRSGCRVFPQRCVGGWQQAQGCEP